MIGMIKGKKFGLVGRCMLAVASVFGAIGLGGCYEGVAALGAASLSNPNATQQQINIGTTAYTYGTLKSQQKRDVIINPPYNSQKETLWDIARKVPPQPKKKTLWDIAREYEKNKNPTVPNLWEISREYEKKQKTP